ncbi:amino acid ABC transporter permease [Pontibacillus salicampi]|uniref:Amino acid ABC transporter permease n=1 Tax=Pontibacillus salicampi TaxID=1449801 RepID=A0ABV6LPE7_9BACI
MIDAIMNTHYARALPALLEGLQLTVLITLIGLLLGFVIGGIFGLGRLSKNKLIYGASSVFVEVVRGTPILAQVLFIYNGLTKDVIGMNIDPFTTGVIAIAINSGAYIAEIVRGAVYSIDKGQHEAGRAQGLTSRQTMRYIIWPQAFRRMIPPLGNQFIISLKDTSLFSVIAVSELLYRGQQYYNATFAFFETLLLVCILYLCVTIPLSIILRRIERKLDV